MDVSVYIKCLIVLDELLKRPLVNSRLNANFYRCLIVIKCLMTKSNKLFATVNVYKRHNSIG